VLVVAFSLMFVGALGFILWAITQIKPPTFENPQLAPEELLHVINQIHTICDGCAKDYITPLDALCEIRLLTERSLHGIKPAPLLILTND
jgi:hypothetical protein